MQLIADESVDFSIVLALRKYGIEVLSIAEQNPSILDEEVLNIAVRIRKT